MVICGSTTASARWGTPDYSVSGSVKIIIKFVSYFRKYIISSCTCMHSGRNKIQYIAQI
jgi:hypothetical protein